MRCWDVQLLHLVINVIFVSIDLHTSSATEPETSLPSTSLSATTPYITTMAVDPTTPMLTSTVTSVITTTQIMTSTKNAEKTNQIITTEASTQKTTSVHSKVNIDSTLSGSTSSEIIVSKAKSATMSYVNPEPTTEAHITTDGYIASGPSSTSGSATWLEGASPPITFRPITSQTIQPSGASPILYFIMGYYHLLNDTK